MLRKKIPPLVFILILGIFMWILASISPTFTYNFPFRWIVGLTFPILGCFVIGYCGFLFRRNGTTVNPTKPDTTSSLLTTGVYSYTRNPMYVCSLFILIGWAYFLSNILAIILLPIFVIYMNQYQIKPEEDALELKFGQEFVEYKSKVRRWL